MTLAELAGLAPILRNDEPIHWWQGASGRWYIHTIYPIHAVPDFITACNYIFTVPSLTGRGNPSISVRVTNLIGDHTGQAHINTEIYFSCRHYYFHYRCSDSERHLAVYMGALSVDWTQDLP